MSAHTPGPWRFHVDNRERDGLWEVSGYNIESNGGEIVGDEGILAGPEGEANARLIAAAPELLDALETALRDSGCDGDLCAHWWHEKARAAINKATGADA